MENEMDKFLKEHAEELKSNRAVNIAEVGVIDLTLLSEIEKETIGEGEKAFSQYVGTYEGKKVRFPMTVLISIRDKKKEYDFDKIQVTKTGTGKTDTKYEVTAIGAMPRL
jgi:hypothetical protein